MSPPTANSSPSSWREGRTAISGSFPPPGGEPTRITDLAGQALAPAFSPDGRWIGFEADVGGREVRSSNGEGRHLVDASQKPGREHAAMALPCRAHSPFQSP